MRLNIFDRLCRSQLPPAEPLFTQAFAAALEHSPEFSRRLGQWLLQQASVAAHLTSSSFEVKTEQPLPGGGIIDMIIDYYDPAGTHLARIAIENKLDAYTKNPWDIYASAVTTTQAPGALILISRRYAKDDPEITRIRDERKVAFAYIEWHHLMTWIRTNRTLNISEMTVLEDFCQLARRMGMESDPGLTYAEIGLAAYMGPLLEKLDLVLGDGEIHSLLASMSPRRKMSVQEWKNGVAFALFSYLHQPASYYVSAGFAYSHAHHWERIFGGEASPIVAFVGVGTERYQIPGELQRCLTWIREKKAAASAYPPITTWHESSSGKDLCLWAYRPLTSFVTADSGLDECRKYLRERLSEIATIFSS